MLGWHNARHVFHGLSGLRRQKLQALIPLNLTDSLVPVTTQIEEPSIPDKLKAPLAALWVSIGLHAALIALVQIAPPSPVGGGSVIEARLMSVEKESVPRSVPGGKMPETVAVEAQPTLPVQNATAPIPAPQPEAMPARSAEPAAQNKPEAGVPRLEIPLAVDLTYYTAREVDVLPQSLIPIEPAYPPEADRMKLSGTVRLKLKLEESGRVSDVEVAEADPPGLFDESALAAFRTAKFSPAQKNGRPVRALVVIEVKYDYAGRLPPGGGERKVPGQ